MVFLQSAMAGTLESSDAQVSVEPNDVLEVTIESTVKNQYGRQIQRTIRDELALLGITSGRVQVVDRGALDCTLRARLQCAAYRACGQTENIPWGGMGK